MKSNEAKWYLMSLWAQASLNEPKWVENQNGPKWAQKTLNIFKIIQYELKIGLNEDTSVSLISLNKLKRI